MIQQVNLYQDILRQGGAKSGINRYWLILSAIVLLFLGFNVYYYWTFKNTEAQVVLYRKNLQAEQARVTLIEAKNPKQEINAALAAEVAQWQTILDELTQTLQMLSGKSLDHSPGFSSYFLALSNQSIPDVWLTALYIDGQRRIIKVEGSTFKPEQIPLFLQQLQKEPVFNDYSFAKLAMQKAKTVPGQLDFKLSTTVDALDSKVHAR